MLRIITGRAGAGKTARIMDELRERVEAGRAGGVLLVPEQYSHEAEREAGAHCRAARGAVRRGAELHGRCPEGGGRARPAAKSR